MGRQSAQFGIMTVLLVAVLIAAAACSRDGATHKAPAKKKKAESSKSARKSYVTPAKFHILLSALDEADGAFLSFWALQNPIQKNVTSPFRAVSSFLKSHQKEDRLEVTLDQCPKFKSRLRITQDNTKEDKPISAVVLDATENCANADFQNIARFNFENSEIRITMRTIWFADGFGQRLARLDREATCVFQLDSEQKLSALKCQGLGQDQPAEGHIELSNFEFTPASGKLSVQGRACAGSEPQCEQLRSTEVILPKRSS